MTPRVLAQDGRESPQTNVMTGRDRHPAGNIAGQIRYCAAAIVEIEQYLACPGFHFLPRFGEPDAARNAIKQLCADLLFERSNTFADCRLGQVKSLSRGGERTYVADQGKRSQGFGVQDIPVPYQNDKKSTLELWKKGF